MSVNEGSNIEPTLAEVLASIRRIAEFGSDPAEIRPAPEVSHEGILDEDDPDFVVPAFLRPNSLRAPSIRANVTVQRPQQAQAERIVPVLPMPPAPQHKSAPTLPAQAPPAPSAAREPDWSGLSSLFSPAPQSMAAPRNPLGPLVPPAPQSLFVAPAPQSFARSSAQGAQHLLQPAVETPKRTLDSAGALFAHIPCPVSQTFATPWSVPDHGFSAAVPEGRGADGELDAASDLSADLLRPLLKQWLDENMSCMVARALQSEAAGGGLEASSRPTSN